MPIGAGWLRHRCPSQQHQQQGTDPRPRPRHMQRIKEARGQRPLCIGGRMPQPTHGHRHAEGGPHEQARRCAGTARGEQQRR